MSLDEFIVTIIFQFILLTNDLYKHLVIPETEHNLVLNDTY